MQKKNIWRNARSEWVVFGIMTLSAVACNGAAIQDSTDPRLLPGRDGIGGVIKPLSPGFRTLVQKYSGFFDVVRHTDFDPELSYLAYAQSEEIDWSSYADSPFLNYVWESGDVPVAVGFQRVSRKRDTQGRLV